MNSMELYPLLQFLLDYGYWLAIPLMILEGPLITIGMGFLSSFGFFNIFIVITLGVISDLISDMIYYWSGYHGGPKVLAKLKIKQVYEDGEISRLREKFDAHPGKIFFGAKVLTGIAHATFVLAGVARVSYPRALRYTIPGGIIWSSALAVLGYYFGKYATTLSKFLSRAGIILFCILILFLLYYFWFGKRLAKKYAAWRKQDISATSPRSPLRNRRG